MTLVAESSSYRDREARVFHDDAGRVCRALSARALEEWDAMRQTQFFQQAVENGHLVRTERRSDAQIASASDTERWVGMLQHEVIPFVSYPYEWSFGMLRDAAVLHLDLLDNALAEDFTLKDGTAYNVQWRGTQPVFIDVISLERHVAGQPWAGYRQFCQTFLFPLLLQAYKNVPFQPWLRGRLEGITPQECWNLMSFRDFFRRGVPSHVFLHAWLQSRRALQDVDSTKALVSAGFRNDQIRANAQGLKRLLGGLRWSPPASAWSGYADANSYSAADQQQKESFVRSAVHARRWGLVWDVGCNAGIYSRIAAENAEQVVAFDADPQGIERLYQFLKANHDRRSAPILPLVNNLVDLSGGLGWRGTERKPLVERGRPELTLCLALVHHLVIGHGVPLRELLTWFAELGTSLVIEFVSKDDPKVQQLLRGRRDNYADYEPAVFDRLLSQMFDVVRTETLASGTRKLYFAKSRSAS
jgi:ribosomal protein L11 methylase PrmA